MSTDLTSELQQQLTAANEAGHPLSIHGSGSHGFMLPDYVEAQRLDLSAHRGIIDYQPTELTLKARAGTPLDEIRAALNEQNQSLPTDFPQFSPAATLGGALAIGHSGSGRPFRGAIRDHILGATLLNHRAEVIVCGGQVMKNVAGYDVSRLIAGSRGSLGPILDITVKVLPKPEAHATLVFEFDEDRAIRRMNHWAGKPLPISAAVFHDGRLMLRLQGTESGVNSAIEEHGGETLDDDEAWWRDIQQQDHPFFNDQQPLWRIVVPSSTPTLELEGEHQSLIDWCGGLRWVHSDEITQADFIHVSNMGGYIEAFRGATPTDPASLMTPLQRKMHGRVKQAFDPDGRFNPKLGDFS
jgi:glycolate oxidase FAD binding subunit